MFSNIETHKNEAVYAPFAKQMTKEVLAVCEAAMRPEPMRSS